MAAACLEPIAVAWAEPAPVMPAVTAFERRFPDHADAESLQLDCRELLPGYEAARSETERVALLTRACLAPAATEAVAGIMREFVVLDARQPSDVLCALWLARRGGMFEPPRGAPTRRPRARSRVDVVPVFERRTAVQRVAETMGTLYANAAYAEQLWARGRRQELVLGYAEEPSDGDGVCRFTLHRAERCLERQARERGLALGVRHRCTVFAEGTTQPRVSAMNAATNGDSSPRLVTASSSVSGAPISGR